MTCVYGSKVKVAPYTMLTCPPRRNEDLACSFPLASYPLDLFHADNGCSVRSSKSSTRNARRTRRSNALVPERVGSRTTFGAVNVSVRPRVRNWQPPAAATSLTQSVSAP